MGEEHRCFVGGLAWATNDGCLEDAFCEFGEVVESKVINDRDTGRSRGFGFVTFADEASMNKAIKEMNGKELDGHNITAKQAQSRGGGGGGDSCNSGGGGCGGGCSHDRGTDRDLVRSSCSWVAANASHVFINSDGIEKLVQHIGGQLPAVKWDFEGIHYFDNGPLTAQYMLVLDALNFCFWPDDELQYDHLAHGLAEALRKDPTAFDAHKLKNITGPMLRGLLHWPRPLPLEDERVRLLHEVGAELERSFDGQAANLVSAAKGSALELVDLVTKHFPGFRDHAVYKGHQVFIYKRAQIFVADLWGAFQGQGIGEFKDISFITMFADYVVPAVLRHWGILTCSQALIKMLDGEQELPSGSEEEVELRACTIIAVERLREYIAAQTGEEVLSVQVDWWLWSIGLPTALDKVPAYHRTQTIYY